MGKWAARIGFHYVTFPDFHVAGLPETSAKPDAFNKRTVEVDYIFVGDKHNERSEKKFKFKLTEIIPLKKERGRYSLDYDKFDLEKTLWDILMKEKIEVWINPYLVAANYSDPAKSTVYYWYGISFRSRDVTLISNKPAPHQLKSYEELLWLKSKNLRYDQCY